MPPIDTDRPDFTDGVHTVIRGRWQLETGYTYQRDRGNAPESQGVFPDVLVRFGMRSDVELRLGVVHAVTYAPDGASRGESAFTLGTKIAVARQRGWFPGISLEAFTASNPDSIARFFQTSRPGAALLLGWEGDSPWSFGAEITASRTTGSHGQAVASASLQFQAADRAQLYLEYYAIAPVFGDESTAQHYANSGVLLRLSNETQIDARFGTGLNHDASAYFFGFGFAMRFR